MTQRLTWLGMNSLGGIKFSKLNCFNFVFFIKIVEPIRLIFLTRVYSSNKLNWIFHHLELHDTGKKIERFKDDPRDWHKLKSVQLCHAITFAIGSRPQMTDNVFCWNTVFQAIDLYYIWVDAQSNFIARSVAPNSIFIWVLINVIFCYFKNFNVSTLVLSIL